MSLLRVCELLGHFSGGEQHPPHHKDGETKGQNDSAISTDSLEKTKEESRGILAPHPALLKTVCLCSLNVKVSFTSTFFKICSVPEGCVLEVSSSLASR